MNRIYTYEIITTTNNWNKLHGLPLRRYLHWYRAMDRRVVAEQKKNRET